MLKKIGFSVLWVALMFFSFFISFMYGLVINPIIADLSELAGISILVILPVAITFLPLIFILKFKQSILKACIISLGIYFVILFICYFTSTMYFSSFAKDKWNKYEHHRYLMVDDLEKSHELIGMTKSEATELLGTNGYWEGNNDNGEHIIKYWTNESKYKGNYYILFLRDNLVVRTLFNKIDY